MSASNRITRSSAISSSNEEKSDDIGLPITSNFDIDETSTHQDVGLVQHLESNDSTSQISETIIPIVSSVSQPVNLESDHENDIDLLNTMNSNLSSQITNPNVGIVNDQNIIRAPTRSASAPFGGRRNDYNTVTTSLQPSQVIELSFQEQSDFFMAKALELAEKARAEKALWGDSSSNNSNVFS